MQPLTDHLDQDKIPSNNTYIFFKIFFRGLTLSMPITTNICVQHSVALCPFVCLNEVGWVSLSFRMDRTLDSCIFSWHSSGRAGEGGCRVWKCRQPRHLLMAMVDTPESFGRDDLSNPLILGDKTRPSPSQHQQHKCCQWFDTTLEPLWRRSCSCLKDMFDHHAHVWTLESLIFR